MVISTKQHLALVVVHGRGLVINLLRWHEEMRDMEGLPLPAEDPAEVGLTNRELETATQLCLDLSEPWQPARFRDELKEKLLALTKEKVQAGQARLAFPLAGEALPATVDIIDLTEMLRQSLKGKRGATARPLGRTKRAAANDEKRAAASDETAADRKESAAPADLPTPEIAFRVAERIQIRFYSVADFRKWAKNCVNRELHRRWTAGQAERQQTPGQETRWRAIAAAPQVATLRGLEALSR